MRVNARGTELLLEACLPYAGSLKRFVQISSITVGGPSDAYGNAVPITVRADSEEVSVPKGINQRKLHKAFLRYHDPDNWPMLRTALYKMGRGDMIGNGRDHLIPRTQPTPIDPRIKDADAIYRRRANKLLTQHTGLPPLPESRDKKINGKTTNGKTPSGKTRPTGRPSSGRNPRPRRRRLTWRPP